MIKQTNPITITNDTSMKRLDLTLLLALLSLLTAPAQQPYATFQPGKQWLDNNAHHINAHGGGIILHEGTYYWYGENRPDRGYTTEVGVEVYSSTDLTNWTDRGVALAVSNEAGSDIERGCIMERPKVLYNGRTGKFVMLFHLELKGRGYEAARVAFAESDTPTGPFRFIRSLRPNANRWPADMTQNDIKEAKRQNPADHKEWWTPTWRKAIVKGMFLNRDMQTGQMSRDMAVYVDDDGTAYHIYSSEDNLTIHIAELTSDYLDYTGRYVRVAPGGQNEAPTLFKHGGRYWLICSGCTGWAPNEARMFVADKVTGPWKQLPSPFHGESPHGSAKTTFGAQGTFILQLQDGRHVFMADIWNPRHLARSLHVWLPIGYAEDGTPEIRWQDEWR